MNKFFIQCYVPKMPHGAADQPQASIASPLLHDFLIQTLLMGTEALLHFLL